MSERSARSDTDEIEAAFEWLTLDTSDRASSGEPTPATRHSPGTPSATPGTEFEPASPSARTLRLDREVGWTDSDDVLRSLVPGRRETDPDAPTMRLPAVTGNTPCDAQPAPQSEPPASLNDQPSRWPTLPQPSLEHISESLPGSANP